MLDQGYGFIVLMNHFSTRDSVQVLALLLGTPAVIRQPILAPVAHHQLKPLFYFCSVRMALQLCPIVTAKTVKVLGSNFIQGSGMAEYTSKAMECLGLGGVLLLAPQGSRRSTLGDPAGRPLGNLLSLAKRRGVKNVALMFIGLGIPSVADYSRKRVGGANIGNGYELRFGQTIAAEEAVHLAGGRRRIDSWSFQQLRRLVPVTYAFKPTPSPGIDAELDKEYLLAEREE
jgi:hypothetical protein